VIEIVDDRLRGLVPAPFKVYGSAADYASVDLEKSPPRAYPACYLIVLREDAQPLPRVGSMRDQVTLHFATVTIVQNVAGERGGAAVFDTATPRGAIRTAINGWLPSGAKHPVRYAGGELLDFVAGRLAWADAWAFTFNTSD